MASRVMSRELYEQLLAAFRDNPANLTKASKVTGVGHRFAKRSWEVGWPRIPYARPIQAVLAEEKIKARAEQRKMEEQLRREQTAEQRKAAEDARIATTQEGQLISAGRATVLGLTFSINSMLPSVRQLTQDIAADVTAGKFKGNPEKAVRCLREVASSMRMLTESTVKLVEVERLVKGEPTSIVGHASTPSEMSLEEAEKTVQRAQSLFALARESGLLTAGTVPLSSESESETDETKH